MGAIADIPAGWFLCDGTNETPDLQNRFLTGAGSYYTVGDIGGENFHQLSIDEMPKHRHKQSFGDNYSEATYYSGYAEKGGFTVIDCSYGLGTGGLPYTFFEGNSQPHENRPPYYAVYYIIRLK